MLYIGNSDNRNTDKSIDNSAGTDLVIILVIILVVGVVLVCVGGVVLAGSHWFTFWLSPLTNMPQQRAILF